MSDNKCFTKECDITGGFATYAELFASVAMGGAIACRFKKEEQMTELAISASEMATKRIERFRIIGKIIAALMPSLLVYFFTTHVLNFVWWLSVIVILILLAIMGFVVHKYDFLKTTIIKLTFNKRLTINIIKKNGLSRYSDLTKKDINKIIEEQYKKIITNIYDTREWDKYTYERIGEEDLRKRGISFKSF